MTSSRRSLPTIARLSLLLGTLQSSAMAAPCDDCNILWIVIDTTRADYMGSHGAADPSTPSLDALAARGTRFAHAYAQGPDTMVSVSSYFSGRRRLNTGMDFTVFTRNTKYHPLSPELTTIAEVLHTRGIRSEGVTANKLIGANIKWDLEFYQGFDHWQQGTDADVETRGIALLDELKDEQFMLYLHFMGPHHPNPKLQGFAERRGEFPEGMPEAVNHIYQPINSGELVLSEQEQDYLRLIYADALWEADARVGRVLEHLNSLGLEDETIVVMLSDHGEALGDLHLNRPVWGHGHHLSKPLLNVPLILAGPGVPEGEVRDSQIAELVDLAPTLTELLGIPQQDSWRWEGEPLLGSRQVAGDWSISDRGLAPKANVAIRDLTHAVTWFEGRPDYYFYWDLTASDGGEARLSDQVRPSPRHIQLRDHLIQYIETADPPSDDVETFDGPDAETLEALQQLGYLE